jgi:cell wall assembly regulator SMI1
MAGPAGASATVDFGSASAGTRPMLLHVHGLAPAPAGHYYELWMRVSSDAVSVATFNTAPSGDATVQASLPADMTWRSCWVTLERVGGGQHTVLRAA